MTDTPAPELTIPDQRTVRALADFVVARTEHAVFEMKRNHAGKAAAFAARQNETVDELAAFLSLASVIATVAADIIEGLPGPYPDFVPEPEGKHATAEERGYHWRVLLTVASTYRNHPDVPDEVRATLASWQPANPLESDQQGPLTAVPRPPPGPAP